MNFSSILDISSFFIGMIINLLLIALICYYFKRKYENLEIAQNEQAKVLYQLLQQNSPPKVKSLNELLNTEKEVKEVKEINNVDIQTYSDSDSDTDSESDSDDGFILNISKNVNVKIEKELNILNDLNDLNDSEIKTINLDENKRNDENKTNDENEQNDHTKEVKIDLDLKLTDLDLKPTDLDTDADTDTSYSKMTIKQLKEILSVKGINANKMKKNEMIELIEKSSVSINE